MLDAYVLRARLAPASLLVAPAVALLVALGFSPTGTGWLAGGTIVALGLIASGQVADRGRHLQVVLFKRWGGSPTTRRLRWREAQADVVGGRHAGLNAVVPVSLPSAREERSDPKRAERAYDDAVATVRATLREGESHRILADTNAEFGFRRNCLAVRMPGAALAATVVVASVVLWAASTGSRPASFLIAALIASGVAWVWIHVVTEDWVRHAAERYADQFFETAQSYLGRTRQA